MASRKSSKQKVILYGGPFDGQTMKLSVSMDYGRWIGASATLMFAVGDEVGQYVNGRWKEYEDPSMLNENIILGDN
jgi:hypothetical protein